MAAIESIASLGASKNQAANVVTKPQAIDDYVDEFTNDPLGESPSEKKIEEKKVDISVSGDSNATETVEEEKKPDKPAFTYKIPKRDALSAFKNAFI